MESGTGLVPPARLESFRRAAGERASGALDEEGFKQARLVVGGHRQRDGAYMLRARVPGGRLAVAAWQALGLAARRHSRSGRVHLTLRQDLQIYDLDLGGLGAAVEEAAGAGLSTYASGGNTVRNITCSVTADLRPGLPFDPYPHAAALSARLSRTPLFHGLPRKFKIGFAGPDEEQAQAWLNDLGFTARLREGRRGFRVLAGGGLGGSAQSAFELEDFLPEDEVGPLAEAVLEYFSEVSPAGKPALNRFKHVLRARGIREARQEARRRGAGRPLDAPVAAVPAPRGSCLWLEPDLGDLGPDQILGLGRALR